MKKFLCLLFLLWNCAACSVAQPDELPTFVFRQPSTWVKQYLFKDSLDLQSVNYQQFRIYFRPDSYCAKHLKTIYHELALAMARINEVLGEEYNQGIYLLAVDSEEEMEQTLGYHIKGGAAQGHDMVFFVVNDSVRPQFKHEIFHLASFERWGKSSNRFLDEGGAVFCDHQCFYENPIYSINAYMLKHKKLLKLKSLAEEFDAKVKENELIAYLQAAGVFQYLYEKFGRERMRMLWEQGFDDFQEIFGISIAEFEKEWTHYIKQIPIPHDIDWEMLLKKGCG